MMFKSYLKNGYAAVIESDINRNWEAINNLKAIIKDNVDFNKIKKEAIAQLEKYENERNNSFWRSNPFTGSASRATNINALKKKLNNLDEHSLISALLAIEKEIKYADEDNGKRYFACLANIKATLYKSIGENEETVKSIKRIINIDSEIQRLIYKQRGEEKAYNDNKHAALHAPLFKALNFYKSCFSKLIIK